jgi:diguanylate cyclase (GGDEF)-like protein
MGARKYLGLILLLWPAWVPAAPPDRGRSQEALVARVLQKEHSEPEATRRALAALLLQLSPGATRRDALAHLCVLTADAEAGAGLAMAQHGLAEARQTGDRRAESKFLYCQGYAEELLGNMMAAAGGYAAAVSAGEASGDRAALAEALAARGELRQSSGEYSGATNDLTRAYDLYLGLGQPYNQNDVLNAMANLYSEPSVGEYDKAIAYYRQLLAAYEKGGNRADIATVDFNIGSSLELKGDLEAAMSYYRRALEIDQARGDAASVAAEQQGIGVLLGKQGQPQLGLRWVEKALAYFQAQADPDGIARLQLARGELLRRAGRLEPALADLDAARAHFQQQGNLRFLVRIDEARALALAALSRWQQAYEALGRQFKAQNALDHELASRRTSSLRVQFDAERTEQQNRELQEENLHRGEALRAAHREYRLQAQVITLGALLLIVLGVLAMRQLGKLRRLHLQAMTDELTGLPNRRSILAFLDERTHIARRRGEALSVVALDIDRFKRINDLHGHDGGDRALAAVARLAGSALRDSDRVGRIGGEEFLLVLPGAGAEIAAEIAERTRLAIAAASFDEISPCLRASVSLGVSSWAGGKDNVEALVKRADEALYRAKQGGRNRVAR